MRRLLGGAAAILLLGAGAAPAQGVPLLEEVWAALSAEETTDTSAAAALDELGDAAVPALCAALWGQRATKTADTAPRPDADDRRRLVAAIGRRDPAAVLAHLDELVEADGSARVRARVIQIIGCFGRGPEIERVLAVAREIAPEYAALPWVDHHYRAAIAAIVARDARGYAALSARWDRLGDLLAATATALADAGTPTAFELLTRKIDTDRGGAVVRALRRMVDERAYVLGRSCRTRLAESLSARDRADADTVNLLVACGEVSIARDLVPLLASKDLRLRRAAHEGLQVLCGLRMPADADLWRAHLDEQGRWAAMRVPQLADMVRSADAATRIKALKELRGRRLHPEVVLDLVSPFLVDEQPATRRLAVDVVASLLSRESVATLIRTLTDEDATVRGRAHAALRTRLGRDLPADAAAWAEAFPRLAD